MPALARLLTLAAALVLAGAVPASAGTPRFTFEGSDCAESVVVLSVPEANVAREVPDGYAVATVGGTASLGVAVLRCREATVDGAPAGPVLVSDVGVSIARPPACDGGADCDGSHFYQLWQVTDSRLLRARMRGLGVDGAVVGGMSFSLGSHVPGLTHASGRVPWPGMEYGISGATVGPVPADAISGTPNWWHETHRGPVRVRYSFPGTTKLAGGAGELETTAGTRLAAILGAERQAGAALLIDASRIRGDGLRG